MYPFRWRITDRRALVDICHRDTQTSLASCSIAGRAARSWTWTAGGRAVWSLWCKPRWPLWSSFWLCGSRRRLDNRWMSSCWGGGIFGSQRAPEWTPLAAVMSVLGPGTLLGSLEKFQCTVPSLRLSFGLHPGAYELLKEAQKPASSAQLSVYSFRVTRQTIAFLIQLLAKAHWSLAASCPGPGKRWPDRRLHQRLTDRISRGSLQRSW